MTASRGSDSGGIVVVGAGIVGASIAYRLAARRPDPERSRPVTVVDAGEPGGGASRASFAWIGRPPSSSAGSSAAWSSAGARSPLRRIAVDEWRRLEAEAGLGIRWTGSLTWGEYVEPGDDRPAADVAAREPAFRETPDDARFNADDGALDPVATCERLVAAAREHGARALLGTRVMAVETVHGRVVGVRTPDGIVAADTVVLAAGTGAAALGDRLGGGIRLPAHPSPSVMIRLRARPGVIRGIVAGDGFEARQNAAGVVHLPVEYAGERTEADLARTAERVRLRAESAFPDLGATVVDSAQVGWRPDDGEPLIGPVPGVPGAYVAVMHSGVTLAAAVGRLVAEELAGDGAAEAAELAPYRLDRDSLG